MMFGVTFPTSDIILVGLILFVVGLSICLEAVTLSKAINNRKVNERTFFLVHRVLGTQLHITSIALRRVADLTGHEDDIIAAMAAEEAHREHMNCEH